MTLIVDVVLKKNRLNLLFSVMDLLHNYFLAIVETCRCEREVKTALQASSLDKEGKLGKVISDVIKKTCGHCQEHGETELIIEYFSSENSDSEPDLSFPVTVSSVRGSQFSKYLPVIQVPGMVVIKRNSLELPGVYQRVVTASIFDSWPIFLFAILSMILAGIVIWILVSFFL